MFAVLHIADFALHAVLRTERAAIDQPAALFSGAGKKSIVLAATPGARARGVEVGMTAPQAVARCPDLLIRAAQAGAESEARATLLAVAFQLSPSVEDTAPGICTIDLRRSTREKFEPAARAGVTELQHRGLPATAGIARTPLLALYAAWASGRPGLRPDAASASSALAVSESSALYDAQALGQVRDLTCFSSPPLVLLIAPADEHKFLGPLPLAAADPSPQLAGVFHHWGLRTLGDLTALPRDEIVRRFGADGLALWQRAAGGEARPLRPVIPPQTFSAALEFEDAIETLEPLLFILRRFLDRLALELSAVQLVAAEIELSLQLDDDTSHARRFRLPEPTAEVEILFRALHTHLESLQTAAAIVAVQLRLVPTRPLVRQSGLFETGLRDPHGFAETLARVVALAGSDRVGTPQLEDTHRPDAVKLIPPLAVIPPPAPPPLHSALTAPLRRFRPPLPARVEFTGDRPTYLWTEHLRGEIAFCSPAFRSDGDWWQRDRAWQRIEWDIGLADGGLYRLLREGDAYSVEGEYD